MRAVSVLLPCALLLAAPAHGEGERHVVDGVTITTLSTMLTEFRGVGEWGFAALVEVDGQRILFDTGGRPEVVLKNAAELGIDLSGVETVVLSHNHWDHTGGLVTLRSELRSENEASMGVVHAGQGIFLPRRLDESALGSLPIPPELLVSSIEVRDAYQAEGGSVVIHDRPAEVLPGVWVTGPIPRPHPEKNWSPFTHVEKDGELVEDVIAEDQALVIETASGLVVVAGCGHAGLVNTLEYARTIADGAPVHAVVGGFHLLNLTDEKIEWTGRKLREFGVEHLIGAHCTGINAVGVLRQACELDRETAVVGGVGTTFVLGEGVRRGLLVR